ncbi:MAG: CRISPR-associated protein Cas5 [Proteobacteria bacterium]|nr:CRISPR-associated protein Cas5 [Pseudomonadota bacterium]
MKALQFIVEGNWAHFKKPETNNNPLTHDFITKTALTGMIGAVLGKEREDMRPLFPQLSEDLLYGVQIINPVKKESWGFTLRKAVNLMEKAPKQMEFLKFPKFSISISLLHGRSQVLFDQFLKALKQSEASYTPVLGLHNCPANLIFVTEGQFSTKQNGQFKTKGIVSKKHTLNIEETREFRIGFERVPTFQNDDFWNLPEKYVEVLYPSEDREITVSGDYYQYSDGECWWLI